MSWRVAQSLLTLRSEVNRAFPDRERASDGGIGDERHAKLGKRSDHNPWVVDSNGVGVVRAFDIDAGPGKFPPRSLDTVGDTVSEIARKAGKAGHPALLDGGYVIYEGKIASDKSSWEWRPHDGDSHESHPHISVGRKLTAFDSKQPWGISGPIPSSSRVPAAASTPTSFPTLKVGDKNESVKLVQRFLWGSSTAKVKPFYGTFEASTETAVRGYQRMRGLPITGVVDTTTWAPIRQALSI